MAGLDSPPRAEGGVESGRATTGLRQRSDAGVTVRATMPASALGSEEPMPPRPEREYASSLGNEEGTLWFDEKRSHATRRLRHINRIKQQPSRTAAAGLCQ
ncbi:hypothetical protein HPB50_004805 [Hyalomma asiaticum]|uniref:Uncharacterized protein n=1 Tax=Hyalomma asiaticum TaxID=266040 RepID=A0ACB7SJU0_HYAAI|nr:hypothetical protein HPB50_004805 [Hyalomma asiaticum]